MSLSKLRKVPSFCDPKEDKKASPTQEEVKLKLNKVARIWERESTFDTKEAALEFVRSENTWRIQTTNKSKAGDKVLYCCNRTRRRGISSCPASLQLLYHCDSLKVSVSRAGEHTGHQATTTSQKQVGIPLPTKEVIDDLFQVGVRKPSAIIESLRKRKMEEPSRNQLTSYISHIKKKKFGSTTANVKALIDWCDLHSEVPNDDDEPYVLAKDITVVSNSVEHLRICLSTKRLLSLTRHADVIHADGTYKLNWNGYPVLVVGTSDKNCVFHPIAISICYQEEEEDYEFIFHAVKTQAEEIHNLQLKPNALMADASGAITNGFEKAFGNSHVRLMCYFHLTKCVDTHIRLFKAELRSEIKADIGVLQLAGSDDEFDAASKLFLLKWRNKDSETSKLGEFVDYFETQWLKTQRFWYEGAYLGGPSTNNGLEATNAVIKRDHTFRERLPVQQFLDLLVNKLIPSWSIERNPDNVNFKPFATEPKLTLMLWTKAYQWASSGVTLFSEEEGPGTYTYYAASSQAQKSAGQVTEDAVVKHKMSTRSSCTFEEYSKNRTSLWSITIIDNKWTEAKCNCPIFRKKFICKHTMGLGIRLGLTDAPLGAKNIPLGQKRKRGRPSKAKLALVVQ